MVKAQQISADSTFFGPSCLHIILEKKKGGGGGGEEQGKKEKEKKIEDI